MPKKEVAELKEEINKLKPILAKISADDVVKSIRKTETADKKTLPLLAELSLTGLQRPPYAEANTDWFSQSVG